MNIVYKTTNLVNHRFYYGVHKTNDINDGYLGSGKLLKQAIIKYGRDNFLREILFYCDTYEKALTIESEIINENIISDPSSYNLKLGGEGGWDYINDLKKDIDYKKNISKNISKSLKKAHKEGRQKGWKINNTFKNKHWNKGCKKSDSTKQKMSIAKLGTKNPNALSDIEINKRINDFIQIEKKYGWISKLSKLWNISHTQVRRFINEHDF